jgi:hypothetical protein
MIADRFEQNYLRWRALDSNSALRASEQEC